MPIAFVKSHQDNTLKEFSEDKLRRFLSHVCEGLSEVDQSRLYDSSVASLSDMVSTVQVYDACILAACGFMSEDPEYDTVATRVLLRKMRREVFGVSTKWGSAQAHSEYCHSFTLSIYRGVEEGRLDERLVDGRFDLDELSDALRPERDELLKFIGLDTLYKKYVQRDSDGVITELPQTFWMRVCMGLAILEDDPTKRAIEFYEIVSQLLSIPSTPTLLQSGTVHPQLSSCFPEGTDISTPSGVVPIEDLKKGDVVLTREGNYCKVVESKQKVTDEIVDINVRGLFTTQTTLSCTPDHLISTIKADAVGCIRQTADMACPTNQGCRARCFAKSRQYARDCDNIQKVFDSSVVAWEEAGKLSTGDYVEVSFPRGKSFSELKVIDYLPDTYTVSDGMVYKLKNDVKRNIVDELSTQTVSVNNHIPVNRDLGLFLGYFLSEGYVNDERTVAFTFNSLDTESMQQCIDAGEKLFGLTPSVLTNGDGSTRITFSSTILARFVLGVMGTGFSEKSLSPLLMEANDDFTLGYIIGVFRGDGCVTRSSSKLSLGNKNAVYQVFQLILKLGYLPTTRSVGIPKGGTTEQYEVSLNTSDALKLIQTIGKDLDRLECTTSGITSRRMWVDGRAFYRIRDISRRDVDVKVYDIEVEQDHTFTASLVSVHNCYINTVDDTLESIYKTYLDNAYLSKWSGGIGTDWTNLRATGSMVKSAGIQSQGVIPFLKIENDSTVAIARSGKRKGARVAYLETWHLDIEDFLDLRRETGDERRRTHDLHTANWIPDLFMIRVAKDEDWTLFSPDEVPDLHDAYGEDFIRLYEKYEQKAKDGLIKQFKVVKAFDLWRKMITRLSETGHPWITFKDTFNVLNPQRHRGVIHSSNLCTEIAINTDADNCAVCNLQSLNLARVMEVPIGLRTIIHSAIRMLDNVIDLNFYPIPEAERSNKRDRPIGLGTMGLQDYLWQWGFGFEDVETKNEVENLYRRINYHAVSASVELAKERGRYESFDGSDWSKSLLTPHRYSQTFLPYRERLQDSTNVFSQCHLPWIDNYKWNSLAQDVSEYGMRNSLLTAIAPTASIGTIAGVLGPCIEPIYSNMFVEENLKGEFTIVNSYLIESLKKVGLWNAKTREDIKVNNGSIQSLEYIPKNIRDMYKTAFEIDQHVLIDLAAIRTPFIDQSQSLNIFYNGKSGKYLSELYQYAWKRGLKSTYYLRSESASTTEKVTVGVEHINTNRVNACRIDDPDCEACQ